MGYNSKSATKRWHTLSTVGIVLIVILLSSMVITGCNGSCNGVGNCNCNGDATCNGNGGSVPFFKQQAHSTELGSSGSATTSSRVSAKRTNFKTFWFYTSDDDYSLGSRWKI